MPLKRLESCFKLHQGSPFGFHRKILLVGCPSPILNSKESILFVFNHVAIAIETEEEM
jgi:hypothetical protein